MLELVVVLGRRDHFGFHEVLDLRFGGLAALAFEHETRGQFVWQVERERQLVLSGSHLAGQTRECVLPAQELLRMLHLLRTLLVVDLRRKRVALLVLALLGCFDALLPVPCKAVLAATLHLYFKALDSRDGLGDPQVDVAGDFVAWLVEGRVANHLDKSVRVVRFFVLEKLHFINTSLTPNTPTNH